MGLGSPGSAVISAIIFNALIIPLLIPLALRGVRYRPTGVGRAAATKRLGLRPRSDHRPVHRHQADRSPHSQPARSVSTPDPRHELAALTRRMDSRSHTPVGVVLRGDTTGSFRSSRGVGTSQIDRGRPRSSARSRTGNRAASGVRAYAGSSSRRSCRSTLERTGSPPTQRSS
jgi:hypothetical protein